MHYLTPKLTFLPGIRQDEVNNLPLGYQNNVHREERTTFKAINCAKRSDRGSTSVVTNPGQRVGVRGYSSRRTRTKPKMLSSCNPTPQEDSSRQILATAITQGVHQTGYLAGFEPTSSAFQVVCADAARVCITFQNACYPTINTVPTTGDGLQFMTQCFRKVPTRLATWCKALFPSHLCERKVAHDGDVSRCGRRAHDAEPTAVPQRHLPGRVWWHKT